VTGKFTHWYLIRGFLKLQNLLVHKLALLMVNDIGIERALFTGLVTGLLRATAAPWER
jgi:hypothetical protein